MGPVTFIKRRKTAVALAAAAAVTAGTAFAANGGGSPPTRARAVAPPATSQQPTSRPAGKPQGLLAIGDAGLLTHRVTVAPGRRMLVVNAGHRQVRLAITGVRRAKRIAPGPPTIITLPAGRDVYTVTLGREHALVSVGR